MKQFSLFTQSRPCESRPAEPKLSRSKWPEPGTSSAKLLLAGLLLTLLAACGGGGSEPLATISGAAGGTTTAAVTTPVPAATPAAPVPAPAVTAPSPGVTTTTNTPTVTVSVTAPPTGAGGTTTTTTTANALPASYRGNITFDTDFAKGSADVVWTRFEELVDLSSYVPSGTARITLTPPLCDAVTVVVPVFATVPNGVGPTLVVRNTNAVAAFQKGYNFTLDVARVPVTFSCRQSATSNVRVTQVISSSLALLGGSCVGNFTAELGRYTDPNQLIGSQVCLPFQQNSATWDFRAP